jgi:2-polyprenyl-3-methyl-5-hydroxy-6-metoxy-1,4-benzoquinol methylase
MNSTYQPDAIANFFDDFGEKEWTRLVQTPANRVSLHVHTHYLKKYLTPNQKILEIGAGAGRFTQILTDLGAQVVVADISEKQLALNKKYSNELGFDKAILDWRIVDICDLSEFESGSFDVIVAYGGPFSYVLDKRDVALSECIRVLRSRGVILLSVMSLWGTAHGFLDGVLSLPPETNQKIITTGDLTQANFPERQDNFMHLFRANELLCWLEEAGLTILDRSASNCLSLTWDEKLEAIRDDAEKWKELLRMEVEACASDGCLNMGTHIIVVVQK